MLIKTNIEDIITSVTLATRVISRVPREGAYGGYLPSSDVKNVRMEVVGSAEPAAREIIEDVVMSITAPDGTVLTRYAFFHIAIWKTNETVRRLLVAAIEKETKRPVHRDGDIPLIWWRVYKAPDGCLWFETHGSNNWFHARQSGNNGGMKRFPPRITEEEEERMKQLARKSGLFID